MNLTNLADIRALLARHDFRFSKSLGQNFLTAAWVPANIADASGADEHTGVLEVGPGIGVFEQIRSFFPQATPILYSVQTKAQLVLRAKELIEEHRLQWDASQNDIAHAFLTIRQGTTDSGQITYSASRTSSTGHADVAWAIMHALEAKPLGRQRGGCVIAV